jgi:putative transposase
MACFVRYADGGGLTAEGRARREKVRLQAAEMFAQDADPVRIARSLRVSTKSVYQWRRAWRAGGQEGLTSKGPGGSPCRLDEAQLEQLRAAIEAGPAVHGWAQDQRWTLARAAALAARLFGTSYTLRGMSFLLHRIGYSPQVPVHRAVERDEAAVAEWRAVTWAKARG